ncbi:MAG: DUF6036 family nucleotidyltransferase [Microbacteriaceae bacterium]
MGATLNRERVIELLTELDQRLEAKGITAELYIVGGAAMALAYDRERLTRDIDAVFAPKSEVLSEIDAMTKRHPDLDPGWMNDAVKGFLAPREDVAATGIEIGSHLRVLIASPERLLAMKIYAARVDRDSDDILMLCRLLGASTIQQVLQVAEAQYGELLTPASRFLTIELLQDHLPMGDG